MNLSSKWKNIFQLESLQISEMISFVLFNFYNDDISRKNIKDYSLEPKLISNVIEYVTILKVNVVNVRV